MRVFQNSESEQNSFLTAASEVNQLQEKIASKEQELKEMNESLSRLAQIKSMYEEKVSELTELLKITEGSLFCAQDKNTALELEIVEVSGNSQLLPAITLQSLVLSDIVFLFHFLCFRLKAR